MESLNNTAGSAASASAATQLVNYDPNVDYVINDYMDRLGTRLNILESELKYAWRALDLLSQEYVKMWERLEKLEGLLYEQQSVISQLLEFYSSGRGEEMLHINDNAQMIDNRLGQLEVIREILGNGTVEDGLEEGVDVSRAATTTAVLINELDLEMDEMDEMRIPDEAFYRSLNQAYRDDLVCAGDSSRPPSQLGMIWEEAEEGEDSNGKKDHGSELQIQNAEQQEVFSAMDYKDYRGNSPCVSENDLAQLTRISSIDQVTLEKLHELDRLTTKLQNDSKELKDLQTKLLESPHLKRKQAALQEHEENEQEARALAEDSSIIDEQLRQIYSESNNWAFSNDARGFDDFLLMSNTNIPSALTTPLVPKKSNSRLSIADSLSGNDAEVAETLSTDYRTPTSPRRRLHIDIATCDPPYTTVTGRLAYSNAVHNAETNASSLSINKIGSRSDFSAFSNEFLEAQDMNQKLHGSYHQSPMPGIEKSHSPTPSICSVRTRQDGYIDPEITDVNLNVSEIESPSPPPPAPGDISETFLMPESSILPGPQRGPSPVFLGAVQAPTSTSISNLEHPHGRLSPRTLHSPKSPRASPKHTKSSSSNIVAAKSDSGLSSMSGWSSLEKSPGSPKLTNKTPANYLTEIHKTHQVSATRIISPMPQQAHPTPIFPTEPLSDTDREAYLGGPLQVPVCNAILPGGHHLSAFTTVKSPCSLETSEGYGNFVPAPAPCSDINVSPRRKSKHQSPDETEVTTAFGDFLYRSDQPTIYSVAGSNKQEQYTSVYTSNSATYLAQTNNYPDLIGNNETYNASRFPPEPNYHAHTTICSVTTTTPSVQTGNKKPLMRGYSTSSAEGLAQHEGYKNAMYRTMFPTNNITDALTYYPTSARYDQIATNLPQTNYNDPAAWLNYSGMEGQPPQQPSNEIAENIQNSYIDPRRYHQNQQHIQEQMRQQMIQQQPIYENQRQFQPFSAEDFDQRQDPQNNWNKRPDLQFMELDLRNQNVSADMLRQQGSNSYYDPNTGVIVSQSGYLSIASNIKEHAVKEDKQNKKLRRTSTLKSAMSSVSNWLPDLHLSRRHRSHSLPSGVSKEDLEEPKDHRGSVKSKTGAFPRKKKRYPLVATMSGILQKAKRKTHHHSQSMSDPEQSETEWSGGRSPSIAQSEDEDNAFLDVEPENMFAKVTSSKPKPQRHTEDHHKMMQEQQHQQQQQQMLLQQMQQQQFQQYQPSQQLQFQQFQQQHQQQQILQQNQSNQPQYPPPPPPPPPPNLPQQPTEQPQPPPPPSYYSHQNQQQSMFPQVQPKQSAPKPPNQLNVESNIRANGDGDLSDNLGEEEASGKSTGSASSAIFATIGDMKKSNAPSEKSDESTTSEHRPFPPVTLGGASMEFAVSRALGKYRQRQSSSVSDDQTGPEDSMSRDDDSVVYDEVAPPETEPIPIPKPPPIMNNLDNHKNTIVDEPVPDGSPSAFSLRSHGNRFFPRHQQSLDIPGGRADDEDNRSTHSWRSGSRVSSRRQSTEDSIDSEDEWYCYELRKLEEMERQSQLETDMGETLQEEPEEESFDPAEDVKEKMSFVLRELRMKVKPKEGILDEADYKRQVVASAKNREEHKKKDKSPKGEELFPTFAKVTTYHKKEDEIKSDVEDHSSGDTSGPDSPNQSMDELDEEEIAAAEAELARSRRSSSGSTLRQTERFIQGSESLSREGSVSVPPSEVSVSVPPSEGWDSEDTATVRSDRPGSSETGTTVSLPKIKIDSSCSSSPGVNKEDGSKDSGPLGSKWKLLKALKERKAEEKNQEKVQDPVTNEKEKVSMISMMQKFYEIHVKT